MDKKKTLYDTSAAPRATGFVPEEESKRPLLRNNFVLMIASAVMIIVGFALMAGSPSGVDEFNPEIFSVRRIVVGPLISFLGFVLMAVAIIVKPKTLKR